MTPLPTWKWIFAALLTITISVPISARAEPAASPIFSELQRNTWYLPTANGAARLYVTEIGRGPPVIFLHEGPGNDFQYIVPALRPHLLTHRFILFDDGEVFCLR